MTGSVPPRYVMIFFSYVEIQQIPDITADISLGYFFLIDLQPMKSSCKLNFNSYYYVTVFLPDIVNQYSISYNQDIQQPIQPTWTFLYEGCPTVHCACSNCPASPIDEVGMVSASVICNVTEAQSTDLYVSQGY